MKNLIRGIFFWLLLFAIALSADAQNQDDVWVFGESAQLNFSTGTPVASTGNAMSAGEGCASVANQAGQVLFYTNGITVWNSNHVPMANGTGLMGHNSSTNSAVIIPKPNSSTIYYIFTTGAADNNFSGGLRYSEVDMCLNGGLGEVTVKNVSMSSFTISEKLTVIEHTTPGIMWLLAHRMNSNEFLAFQISASGVSLTPVTSGIGISLNIADDARGELKASPSGQKIAMPIRSNRTVHLFDFNRSTGAVSNSVSWGITAGGLLYGAEFSPDETKLYITRYGFGAFLHQFNLTAGSAAAIGASGAVVGSSSSEHMAGMKLASNGKIYVTRQEFYGVGGGASNGGAAYLAVVNFPNILGTACNFVDNGVFLAGGRSRFGLPPKVRVNNSTPSTANLVATTGCAGNTSSFTLSINNQPPTSVTWNFDDPGSGTSNTSTSLSPTHIYSNAGTYTVTATYVFECVTSTISQVITIAPPAQTPNLGPNTAICQGTSLTLTTGLSSGPFLWNNGSTGASLAINSPGTYWVQVGSAPCLATDSIVVSQAPQPTVNLGPDKIICQGSQTTLSVQPVPGNTYTWSTGTTGPALSVTTPGNYTLTVDNGICSASDQVSVTVLPLPVVALGNDQVLCPGESLTLSAGNAPGPFQWSNGAGTPTITITSPGIYWLEAGVSPCQARDSITVLPGVVPVFDLGGDVTICEGQEITLSVNPVAGYTYLWNSGATSPAITVTNSGTYTLTQNNGTCSFSDSVSIIVAMVPQVSLGPDLPLCPGSSVTLSTTGTTGTYSWNTGSTAASILVSAPGTYWVEVSTAPCSARDTIVVNAAPLPLVNLGADTTLCTAAPLSLSVDHVSGQTYLWSTGHTSSAIQVTTSGTYWVITNNGICQATDSIKVSYIEQFTLGADTAICEGQNVLLQASQPGNFTYSWNTGSTNSAIAVSEPGNYWVQITNANCQIRDSIFIIVHPLPVVNLGNDTTLCAGNTFSLTSNALPGSGLLWNTGSTDAGISVSEAGSYWLQVTNLNGCTQADSLSVAIQALPQLNLGNDTTICDGEALALTVSSLPGQTYLWNTGETLPILLVSSPAIYSLEITLNGCKSSDSVEVFTEDCTFFVPNIFTPNNDNSNDYFVVNGMRNNIWELTIFNRYGKVIYNSPNYKNTWDGSSASDGIYYYHLVKQNSRESYKGYVTILR